jgi:EAL domain-containing protein (putative c-di-GMP-specific phosphodiesterase class I)
MIVAEGIETASQLGSVHAIGCELGQGYLLAKPAPAALVDPSRDRVTARAVAQAAPAAKPAPSLTLVKNVARSA